MTQIAQMTSLDNANSSEFVKILKDKDLLIYEDIQGSKIFIKWNGKRFIIKPKSLKNDPLNFIDLTIQKYYNFAFDYFYSLPEMVTELLITNWWFCFEYFADNQPAHIEYNKMPKNNLILTCIVKGNKYVYNFNEIIEYSKLFNVEPLPIIFKGKLSDKQLEVIELYLNTKEDDLKFLFGESNFSYFFYKILNPNTQNSFLMRDDNFNDNLEKIIIKIDGKDDYSFEILNPLYTKMSFSNSTEYVEIYSLILLIFLEFIQLLDLEKYKLKKISKDELYIEYICLIFNEYMKNNAKNIINWEFTIPEFFKEDKFKINVDMISNNETKDFIKSSDKIEYFFKCILGSFNKKRNKPVGVFNETTLNLFNEAVDKISRGLDKFLKINHDYEFQKGDLKNFSDYFQMKYNTDSTGELYPDVYNKFTGSEEGGDKKGKKKPKEIKGVDKNIEKGKDSILNF